MASEKNVYSELSLETLAQGEDGPKIQAALEEIYDNIDDPNTDASASRRLTYTVEFRPGANRENVAVTTSVKVTTAPVKKTQTPVVLVRRGDRLHGYAFNPRQGDLIEELRRKEAAERDPQVASIETRQAAQGGQS